LVVTKTALTEFLKGPFAHAGQQERLAAYALLARSVVVADNPSQRVLDLTPNSNKSEKALGANDKIIFSTGDKSGWQTVKTDKRFVDAAAHRGVLLDVAVFQPSEYTGH
jgi:hypothetical protein